MVVNISYFCDLLNEIFMQKIKREKKLLLLKSWPFAYRSSSCSKIISICCRIYQKRSTIKVIKRSKICSVRINSS